MNSAKAKVCGVMAYPVEHSLSPMMHNFYGEAMGLDFVYVPLKVEPGYVEEAVKGAYALNFSGMNVTVPHKQAVIPHLLKLDSAAAAIGAVNTLVRAEGGYIGYNTDGIGLARSLKEAGISVRGRDCILLGAGGAAKAAAYVLGTEGAASVVILNRSLEKAECLAEEMNRLFGGNRMSAMALSDYEALPGEDYLAIQTTSVGMHPHGDQAPVEDPRFYEKIETAVDVIYTPSETRFLRLAREAGARTLNGLDMLIYQGGAAFELGNPQVTVAEAVIAESRRQMQKTLHERQRGRLILIGFMGAGKTTVGQALAGMLGWSLVDTDQMIEEVAGMSISRIFETQGEAAFRELETAVLKNLSNRTENLVISVGGGLPLREENRTLLRQLGTVIYLRVQPDTVLCRLKGDTTRPLLQGENVKERVSELLAYRGPIYEAASHEIVDVDEKTPQEAAEEIIRVWKGEKQS